MDRFRKALQSLLTASNPFSTGKSDQKESCVVDCCICLSGIGPFQALFLSPCSHCFHYKCVSNILSEKGLMFPCPVCRQVANLEASVSMESLCDPYETESTDDSKEDLDLGEPAPFQLALESKEIKPRLIESEIVRRDITKENQDESMDDYAFTLSGNSLSRASDLD